MANIIFGFGTSHSPLLSTPPDKWHLRVEADKKNPSLEYKGKSYVYDELVELRKTENLEHQSSLEVRTERHAASRNAIDKLADVLEKQTQMFLLLLVTIRKNYSEMVLPLHLACYVVTLLRIRRYHQKGWQKCHQVSR